MMDDGAAAAAPTASGGSPPAALVGDGGGGDDGGGGAQQQQPQQQQPSGMCAALVAAFKQQVDEFMLGTMAPAMRDIDAVRECPGVHAALCACFALRRTCNAAGRACCSRMLACGACTPRPLTPNGASPLTRLFAARLNTTTAARRAPTRACRP